MRSQYERLGREEIMSLGWLDLGEVVVGQASYNGSVWSEEWDGQLLLAVQLSKSKFFLC